ncbi:MAG: carotenoid 1,2-hydratase [Proteobacteria bacterium]|nr:carotenoid 1,2-hydratase [Pseudomonadota bacterium]
MSRRLPSLAGLLACLCALAPAVPRPGAAAPADLGVLAPGTVAAGFQQAQAPRAFSFPADHGPHPQFRHEWWYFTGNLDSDRGERFGFELTFFRFALTPPPPPRPRDAVPAAPQAASHAADSARATGDAGDAATRSPWRTREIYMAHFAITDAARHRFVFQQKFARAALDLAGARAEPFAVWLGNWKVSATTAPWTLAASQPGYGLQLALQPLGAPVLNGERGLSRKSSQPGSASYYYSIPRLAVTGRLLRDGIPLAVHGLAWFDREWGSGGLGPGQAGWDWFALQLTDGSTLMFYALRNRDGSRDPRSAGTWVDPQGRPRTLTHDEVNLQVLDRWHSPRGGTYPSRWRVQVASLDLDLAVNPVLPDQELTSVPRYWEGAVDVGGSRAGRPAAGRGYVEQVGYGPPAAAGAGASGGR